MTIITRSFYWAGPPIPVGGAWFIATPTIMGSDFQALELPEWLPQQVFISRMWAAFEYDMSGQQYMAMEIEAWVDPKGASYYSTDPVGQEGNYQRSISVMQTYDWHPVQEVIRWSEDFSKAPILWNRANGDLFAIKFACSQPTVWSAFEIQFQINTGFTIPTTTGPGY